MYRYTLNFIILTLVLYSQILSYECNTLKLDNMSSNRALTTLKALGYNTIVAKISPLFMLSPF